MHVVRQVHRIAVIRIDAPRRRRAPVGITSAAAVAAPGYVDDQVILAVVLELLIEGEAEPGARGRAKVVRAPAEDLERRVAAEIGNEVGGELGNVGMTQFDGEVVITTGGTRFAMPFPSLDGTAGNRIRT
jgi:hypothetical protein